PDEVLLHVPDHDVFRPAAVIFHGDLDDAVGAAVQQAHHLGSGKGDGLGLLVPPVNDGRHQAGPAQLLGLARLAPLGLELNRLHRGAPPPLVAAKRPSFSLCQPGEACQSKARGRWLPPRARRSRHVNKVITDRSSWRRRMAWANRGATLSTVKLGGSSSCTMVLVTMTSWMGACRGRSMAGPDRTGWVAQASTLSAPRAIRARAASAMVPAVSIMSSTMMHVLPATSPTTLTTSASLGAGRRLSMMAKGNPRRSPRRRARVTPPVSGETTTPFWMSRVCR